MTWKVLRHPNVLPLLGVTIEEPLAMVSEWMKNGNIKEFVGTNSHVNRWKLVGVSTLTTD